ncbi:hypothetical protein [Pseudomonas sp. NFACC13-1]|nr:hypothetical protein [Pseudomonas sp. NFACC13-1]
MDSFEYHWDHVCKRVDDLKLGTRLHAHGILRTTLSSATTAGYAV